MRRTLKIFLAAALIASTAGAAAAENWPFFKNDAERSGNSQLTADAADSFKGEVEWSAPAPRDTSSSPAVYGGTIYVGSNDGAMYAYSLKTGEERWKFDTGNWISTAPAVYGGQVFVTSYDSRLYCVDALTGDQLWQFTTSNNVQSSPAAADGVVYFGSDDSYVYAVTIKTGWQKWKFKTDAAVTGSPIVADGVVYVGNRKRQALRDRLRDRQTEMARDSRRTR